MNQGSRGRLAPPPPPPIIRLHVIVYNHVCILALMILLLIIILYWSTPPNTPWAPQYKIGSYSSHSLSQLDLPDCGISKCKIFSMKVSYCTCIFSDWYLCYNIHVPEYIVPSLHSFFLSSSPTCTSSSCFTPSLTHLSLPYQHPSHMHSLP